MEEGRPSGRERVQDLARRRRRKAFVKSVVVFVVVAIAFTGVMVGMWGKFKRTHAYKLLTGQAAPPEAEPDNPDIMFEGGFHLVDDAYWTLFDEAVAGGEEVRTPPPAEGPGVEGPRQPGRRPKPVPAGVPAKADRIQAEGLKVHAMAKTGPYTIDGDLGGLIAARVGIWKSPNKLGSAGGSPAFYCEHLETVKVTHWARNLIGFRVYRVVKGGRAGWVLGAHLLDENDEKLK